jgi:hypothetical protein
MSLLNVAGMFAVLCFLGAYAGMQLGFLSATSFFYSFCNLVGALAMLISISQEINYAVVVVQISWALISLVGMVRSILVINNNRRQLQQH